jgi:hypothetical protein
VAYTALRADERNHVPDSASQPSTGPDTNLAEPIHRRLDLSAASSKGASSTQPDMTFDKPYRSSVSSYPAARNRQELWIGMS